MQLVLLPRGRARERTLVPLCLTLLLMVSSCYSDDDLFNSVEVVGVGECSDCKETNVLTRNALSGLRVTIDCKVADGKIKTRGVGKVDKQGKFKVSLLPSEILKENGEMKEECFAQLRSASSRAGACPQGMVESSKLIFKSKDDNQGKHIITFVTKGKLSIASSTASTTCASAFFWPPLPEMPPLTKTHPWFKTLPKYKHPWFKSLPKHPWFKSLPKHPWFKSLPKHPWFKPMPKFNFPPKVFPPIYKPIPPPVPIYKPPTTVSPPENPTLPPTPVPVYKPPTLSPPVYKSPPKVVVEPPVYKKPCPPPVPVYTPSPKPKVEPPPTPVYYNPTPTPNPVVPYKPNPPVPVPVPVYKPHPPIYTKPLPPIPHFPPIIKKPCPPLPNLPPLPKITFPPFPKIPPKYFHHHPPLPKIPPKYFHHHHPKFGSWPPYPSHP